MEIFQKVFGWQATMRKIAMTPSSHRFVERFWRSTPMHSTFIGHLIGFISNRHLYTGSISSTYLSALCFWTGDDQQNCCSYSVFTKFLCALWQGIVRWYRPGKGKLLLGWTRKVAFGFDVDIWATSSGMKKRKISAKSTSTDRPVGRLVPR